MSSALFTTARELLRIKIGKYFTHGKMAGWQDGRMASTLQRILVSKDFNHSMVKSFSLKTTKTIIKCYRHIWQVGLESYD